MASLPSSKIVTYEEWLRMPEVTDAIEEVVTPRHFPTVRIDIATVWPA